VKFLWVFLRVFFSHFTSTNICRNLRDPSFLRQLVNISKSAKVWAGVKMQLMSTKCLQSGNIFDLWTASSKGPSQKTPLSQAEYNQSVGTSSSRTFLPRLTCFLRPGPLHRSGTYSPSSTSCCLFCIAKFRLSD